MTKLALIALIVIAPSVAADAGRFPLRTLGLPGDPQPRCHGVQIAPRLLLTAAGCVWDPDSASAVEPGALRIDGPGDEPSLPRRILVASGSPLALVELGEGAGDEALERAPEAPAPGTTLTVAMIEEAVPPSLRGLRVSRVRDGVIQYREESRSPTSAAGAADRVPAGATGGAVLDGTGRLVGIALVVVSEPRRAPSGTRGFLKILSVGASERIERRARLISVHSPEAQALFARAASEGWDLPPSFRPAPTR